MSFLDCNGALIPYQFESWREANRKKESESKLIKKMDRNPFY